MGDFVQSLLGSLAGSGGPPGSAPSPVGVVPPESGDMTRAVMGFPALPYGGDPGPVPPAPPGYTEGMGGGMSPEVDAIVRGFKPKHISFWGALGDQLMKHWGNQPVFSQRIEEKNLGRAMEGFTTDPIEAIRRIAQIPGHGQDAWNLLNTVNDNTRADQAQNRLMGKDRESIIEKANRYFGAVRPDGSNWPAVREAYQNVMRRNGIDVALPEEWDPDLVALQIASGMTMNQQEMNDYRNRDLTRKEANTASQIEHRDVQEAQGERRLNQADTAEAGRNTRSQNSGKTTAGKKEPGLQETDAVRPGESMQIMRQGDKIIAARVKRKDQYGRDTYILLSPGALAKLKTKLGQ